MVGKHHSAPLDLKHSWAGGSLPVYPQTRSWSPGLGASSNNTRGFEGLFFITGEAPSSGIQGGKFLPLFAVMQLIRFPIYNMVNI